MRNTETISLSFFIFFYFLFATGNFIDGDALLMLPNDFDEFCHLVPQGGIRMKLKAVVEKYCSPNNCRLVKVSKMLTSNTSTCRSYLSLTVVLARYHAVTVFIIVSSIFLPGCILNTHFRAYNLGL